MMILERRFNSYKDLNTRMTLMKKHSVITIINDLVVNEWKKFKKESGNTCKALNI